WRNAVIGLGQRGLGDILLALQSLPEDIRLHVQGRLPSDGGAAFRQSAMNLGVWDRITIHPPFAPHEAVLSAAHYHVGLCPERPGNRNHELTVSNKIFDYCMAGLAVIASDLPGLRTVVEKSQGGVVFRAGDPS